MAYIIVKTKSTFFWRLNQFPRLGYFCLINFVFSNFLSNITPFNSYPPYAKANEPATLLSPDKRSIFTAKEDDNIDVPGNNGSLTTLLVAKAKELATLLSLGEYLLTAHTA